MLVADMNRSILFYTKELHFEISFLYEDFYCGIIKDGHSIHLKLALPAMEERANRQHNEHADLVISVEHIADLYDEIKSKPVSIMQPLRKMPYGKEFYIKDPDGYVIAFLEEK